MENTKLVILSSFVIFIFPFFTFAYEPETAHRGLTHDIIRYFEYFYPNKLSGDDKQAIERGSVDEDNGTRALNHFYDPVHDKGILYTSKEWAVNTLAQARTSVSYTASLGNIANAYFSSESDYSWERAIYEYVHGDKNRGMESLGHVLHLTEDATVPDHTRDDPHPPFFDDVFGEESPYEHFTNRFTANNINVSKKLINEGKKPVLYGSPEEYFDKLATYSNNNFFSKDTIFSEKYVNPAIKYEVFEKLSDGVEYKFGYNVGKLVMIEEFVNVGERKLDRIYSINDKDNLILTNYWNLLSEAAVQNGAGVVKLFFDEVEKEKKTLALRGKNTSWLEKQMGAVAKAFSTNGSPRANNSVPATKSVSEPVIPAESPVLDTALSVSEFINEPPLPEAEETVPVETQNVENPLAQPINSPAVDNVPMPKINLGPGFSPGFGGGAAPATPTANNEQSTTSSENASDQSTTTAPVQPSRPERPAITSPSDFSTPFAITTITFTGTSSPNVIISSSFSSATTTVDNAGNWSLVLTGLPETTTTVSFMAEDQTGATSTPNEISLSVYIPRPPAPTITSPAFPLQLRTKSVTFSGTSTPGFVISNDLNSATTSVATSTGAWSIAFSNLSEGTTTIRFFATGNDGVASNPKETTFNVFTIYPKSSNLTVPECARSLQSPPNSCTLPEGNMTLTWSVNTPNYRYFDVIRWRSNSGYVVIASTTATTITIQSGEPGGDFLIKAVDIFGQPDTYYYDNTQSPGNRVYVYAIRQPIVINEVAWGGTAASSNDEWIELKNRTVNTLNLAAFSIAAEDGVPTINLSGTIEPNGHYLIERTNDTTVSDIAANLVVPFSGDAVGSGLSNGGEVLKLVFGGGSSTTTIDQTPALSDCAGTWCAGSASPDYRTMERRQVDTSGADKNNWMTNGGTAVNGHDNAGNSINGTPKTRNSVSLGKAGFYCSPYTASFVENGHYLPTIRSGGFLDCHFLSPGLSGSKYAALYRGTTASSTRLGARSAGSFIDFPQTINVLSENFVSGENYFNAVYVIRPGSSDDQDFNNFFTGASTTPPHNDYGVVNWIYGP